MMHLTIGAPNKKSNWRVVMQISGANQAISLSKSSIKESVEILLPILLKNKTGVAILPRRKNTFSYTKLRQYYVDTLTASYKKLKGSFVAPCKPVMTISLESVLFKKNNQPKYFRINEPTSKNSVTLSVNKNLLSKTLGLKDRTIEEAVNDSFEQFLSTVPTKYSEEEVSSNKAKLIKILEKDYQSLCLKFSPEAMESKFNSIAGIFHKNNKFTGIDVYIEPKGLNPHIRFNKANYPTMSRSLDKFGFDTAFEEVFAFGCEQLGVDKNGTVLSIIKSQYKSELQKNLINIYKKVA